MEIGTAKDCALQRLITLDKRARDFGFKWPDLDAVLQQILSEHQEVVQELVDKQSEKRLREEIGDLLHAVISLCVFLEFTPQELLQETCVKFQERMNALMQLTKEQGLQNLDGQPIEFQLQLWEEAKRLAANQQFGLTD